MVRRRNHIESSKQKEPHSKRRKKEIPSDSDSDLSSLPSTEDSQPISSDENDEISELASPMVVQNGEAIPPDPSASDRNRQPAASSSKSGPGIPSIVESSKSRKRPSGTSGSSSSETATGREEIVPMEPSKSRKQPSGTSGSSSSEAATGSEEIVPNSPPEARMPPPMDPGISDGRASAAESEEQQPQNTSSLDVSMDSVTGEPRHPPKGWRIRVSNTGQGRTR